MRRTRRSPRPRRPQGHDGSDEHCERHDVEGGRATNDEKLRIPLQHREDRLAYTVSPQSGEVGEPPAIRRQDDALRPCRASAIAAAVALTWRSPSPTALRMHLSRRPASGGGPVDVPPRRTRRRAPALSRTAYTSTEFAPSRNAPSGTREVKWSFHATRRVVVTAAMRPSTAIADAGRAARSSGDVSCRSMAEVEATSTGRLRIPTHRRAARRRARSRGARSVDGPTEQLLMRAEPIEGVRPGQYPAFRRAVAARRLIAAGEVDTGP